MALRSENRNFEPRYTFGGDEFILVEFDDAMSLETNLRVQEIARNVERARVYGVIDVCPANISYLVRYDPDVIEPSRLVDALMGIYAKGLSSELKTVKTRIVDVPILFADPWTHEVLMKFRDRVQELQQDRCGVPCERQWPCRTRGVDARNYQYASHGDDDRLRAWGSLVLPNGREKEAIAGSEVPSAAYANS